MNCQKEGRGGIKRMVILSWRDKIAHVSSFLGIVIGIWDGIYNGLQYEIRFYPIDDVDIMNSRQVPL